MTQAATNLRNCPSDINLSTAYMSWGELRDGIFAAYKRIEHLFFCGTGNRMQFEDSCIREGEMLNLVAMDAPALPVHDSFVLHHGCGGEIKEAMRRTFYDRFGGDIPTSNEMLEGAKADDSPPVSIGLDELLEIQKE